MKLEFQHGSPEKDNFGINKYFNYGAENVNNGNLELNINPIIQERKRVRFKDELNFERKEPPMLIIEKSSGNARKSPFQSKDRKPLFIHDTKNPQTRVKNKKMKFQNSQQKALVVDRPHTSKSHKKEIKKEWVDISLQPSKYFDSNLESNKDKYLKKRQEPHKSISVNNYGYLTSYDITKQNGVKKSFKIYRELKSVLNDVNSTKNYVKRIVREASIPKNSKAKEDYKMSKESLERPNSESKESRLRYEYEKAVKSKEEIIQNLKEELHREQAHSNAMNDKFEEKLKEMQNLKDEIKKEAIKIKESPLKEKKNPIQLPPPKIKVVKQNKIMSFPMQVKKQKYKIKKPKKVQNSPKKETTVVLKEEKGNENLKESGTKKEMSEKDIQTAPFLNSEASRLKENFQSIKSEVTPLLLQIDKVRKDMERVERIKNKCGIIGYVSEASGRYIAAYADKLSELIFDDILIDMIQDMNEIEIETKQKIISKEEKRAINRLEEELLSFQEEEEKISKKYLDNQNKIFVIHPNITTLIEPPQIDNNFYKNPFDEPRLNNIQEELILFEKPRNIRIFLHDLKIEKIREYSSRMRIYKEKKKEGPFSERWKFYDNIAQQYLEKILRESAIDLNEELSKIAISLINQEFSIKI